MSQWRKEASLRLPEMQRIIASPDVDSPMMLWIELNREFEGLCQQSPPPLDLLRRIWWYGKWCLEHRSPDVQTAAALAFCEHLVDTPGRTRLLPLVMSRTTYEGLAELIRYHNGTEGYERGLAEFARA